MSALVDYEIERYARRGMIKDYCIERYGQLPLSAGVTSMGYDARLSPVAYETVLDPAAQLDVIDPTDGANHPLPTRRMPVGVYVNKDVPDHPLTGQPVFTLAPKGFMLGHTIETFSMPEDVMAICQGKSSYARVGIHVNVTPLEPGWEGQVTLEIFNQTPHSVMIFPWRGICQFQFFKSKRPNVTYADKAGKYQGQMGVTHAK